jgi:hypothetical protein
LGAVAPELPAAAGLARQALAVAGDAAGGRVGESGEGRRAGHDLKSCDITLLFLQRELEVVE